jgi:hypothetical protein
MSSKTTIGITSCLCLLLLLAYACQNDSSYKDEYILLLEEKISKNTENSNLEENVHILSRAEVLLQVDGIIDFACDDRSKLIERKVMQNNRSDWFVLLTLRTDSIDSFGFDIERTLLLNGKVENGIFQILELNKLIEACE